MIGLSKDYAPVALSCERGQQMARWIGETIRPLENLSVLDIGCRFGGISLSFAEVSRQATAIDIMADKARRAIWKERSQEAANLSFACGNAIKLPFRNNAFGMVLINGVLEWVGLAGKFEDPRDLQKRCLEEAKRVLKNDGFLYLAIENRLFPGYIRKDPHAKIPLVSILPRAVANGITKRFRGTQYRTFIYSFWGLKKLVHEAGFTPCAVFMSIYTYWYPLDIQPISDRKGILQALANLDRKEASIQYRQKALVTRKQRLFVKIISFLGLARMLSNAFVVIGWKCEHTSRAESVRPIR